MRNGLDVTRSREVYFFLCDMIIATNVPKEIISASA